ncbi:MAG: acyl-CoA dehydrogenase [Novosphingobium sp.]|nr:acyl-CoA dehydrogenase [Novosphingobium sp.]
MSFTAATDEQEFALRVCAGIEGLAESNRFAAATPDMVRAIVDGVAALAEGEWAPLNRLGDVEGAHIGPDGKVVLPDGFREAYQAYVEGGWNSLHGPVEYGGQGLPMSLAVCVLETLASSNMALSLNPMLSVGAIAALHHHGSEAQKETYLHKLVSGEWCGTMNLTEPQAGTDVGALRTSATRIEDGPNRGKYLISGQKIFITWGEHEVADNIVHLLLARTPDAPSGSRGISLFIVPKYHVNENGSLGDRNDLRVVSLEHKLGIKASPTCVMSYGDEGQCIGEIVGEENAGLRAMFTMMNDARVHVGTQGLALAERAAQAALAYSKERIQSARAGSPDKTPVPIIEHPDVRRMVLRIRALVEGGRALVYYGCGQLDRGSLGDAQAQAQARGEVLVPLIKGWCTDMGVEVTSLAVQVHGGMGFIEETGVAQHYRDVRITPIYEGTNGVQAADLVGRKLSMENGGVVKALLAEIAADCDDAPNVARLAADCTEVADWMLTEATIDDRLAASVDFQRMFAVAVAGWQLARQARAARQLGAPGTLGTTKPLVARWFHDHIVLEAIGLKQSALAGASLLYDLDAEALTS